MPARALTILLLSCLGLAAPAAAETAPKPVKLLTVEERSAQVNRQFFGQVVARETVDLAFQVGGQIVEFPVIEGEPVPKGELVARLDLESFELALEQARLEKEQADRNLERLEKLKGSTVSQVSIDDARTAVGLAAIKVRNAEKALDDATLLAPFDALVAGRNVANFTTIAAGTPVVRLHDMSEVRIEIDVPEILFQRAGRDPDLELFAVFPTGPKRFPLAVREFNAETSTIGQTFRITMGMARPEGLNILPGSSVTVVATVQDGETGLMIPAPAVVLDADGAAGVMVYDASSDGNGTVARRTITLEALPDGSFRVTEGLEPGEVIVAAGGGALEDGQTVRPFTGFPN